MQKKQRLSRIVTDEKEPVIADRPDSELSIIAYATYGLPFMLDSKTANSWDEQVILD